MEIELTEEEEMAALKTRESRLRRAARRHGLTLVKSRRRDPRALDFGNYWVVDPQTGGLVAGCQGCGMSLDDVQTFFAGDSGDRQLDAIWNEADRIYHERNGSAVA
jgi:hypothetical protein